MPSDLRLLAQDPWLRGVNIIIPRKGDFGNAPGKIPIFGRRYKEEIRYLSIWSQVSSTNLRRVHNDGPQLSFPALYWS